ncbi:MAG TPA: hypothetical protein GX733_05320 [Tissierellia bacterium]|nr:hypothetical protein [Tissierellia bacterium]
MVAFLTGGGPALQGAREYLGVLLWFSPVYIIFQSLIVLLRNDGGARRAMTALLLCSVLNIALDALFIFGFQWGMFGAGFATGIAQVSGLVVALLPRDNAKLLRQLRPRLFPPLRLMGKGLASFVMELSQGVVIFVFNAVLLRLVGELGVSSYAIIANLSLMFTSIFLGLAQGAQPLLSVAKGKADHQEFQDVLQFSKQVCLVLSLSTVLICLVIPQLLARVFISGDPEVLEMTIGGLRLYSLGFLFLGFNLIGTVALQSAAESVKAFLFAMVRGMMLLIVDLFILQHFFGTTGVWLAFPVTELMSYLWMRRNIRKEILS